jgi:uncharacterized membrane protein
VSGQGKARVAGSASRFDRLDALRGAAMVWMAVFHFCFDLNHFRFIRQDFYRDPFWTWQRTCIVTLFLLCAGASQAVALHQGQGWPRGWLWPLGLVAVLLPKLVAHPFFDSRATNWVGLVTRLPPTEDWVPLLPWLGVVLWGLAAGQWLLEHRRGVLAGPLPRAVRPLATLGRWSLSFYMVHQPVLIGALTAWVWLTQR